MDTDCGKTVIGGIEGGGGHSIAVLFDGTGTKLVEVEGPSTNHWLIGMDECLIRINNLIQEAKQKAQLPSSLTLKVLGLSLSGCEDEESNNKLKEKIAKQYPSLSENYYVCSDTVGAIATASELGGLVLISGTGSNSLLLNPDGSTARCGGWGYLLGDEGSAWWISQMAIKIFMDEEDNRVAPPHDTKLVKEAILSHFNIKDRFGLLEHFYANFNKATIAGLCAKVAEAARNGDLLSQHIFHQAGVSLGEYIGALIPSIDKVLLDAPKGLPVICVGGVWHSFELLKQGFIKGAQTQPGDRRCEHSLKSFSLLRLEATPAVGAAYLGAKSANIVFHKDYSKNASVLFQHTYE